MSSILKGLQLNELSNTKLGDYKTAASADATAADKAGDYKRGDKRMSGIIKATKKEFDNDKKKKDVAEAGIPFRGVGGAFNRGDDERHDLDVQQPSSPQVWGLKINGKVWSKEGKDVTFKTKEAALNIRNSILKNRPDLEIGLVTKGGVSEEPMNEGVPSDNDMGVVPDVRSGTSTKMTLGQWKQMWLKKMPHADQGMFRYPPAMKGSFIAYFDGWENTPGARWDPQQSVSEEQLDELKCWPGHHRVAGTKAGAPGSCEKNKTNEESVAEEQLNELDMFAPVTTFIKMTDGSYIQADWRKSQGNPGLSDSASFVNFKPVNPNVAKQLGLDSYQRNNSISNHRDGTIVPGGPIQGSGPLANRGYEVVDYNKPETMKELPSEIKSELIKWVQKQNVTEESCPHCNGPMFSEMIMNEKKDACYYKVKSRYKVWPSAYASGALVKCRKSGADSWGNGGKKNESSILEGIERADESLHDWFNKEKWVRMDTKGNIKGPCAKEPGEGKPKCLPQSKAHSLGKKGRASAAQRKRREDPNPERSGKAINVNTKKQSNENIDEDWKKKLGAAALAGSMALGAAGASADTRRVTPDGQGGFTGGLKPTATVVAPDNTPSATPPTSDTSDPFKGLARAESADRQAQTITVGGKEYRMVEISPTDIRPRSGKQIVVSQGVLGERGIGTYMGILTGNTVFVISK